MKNNLLISLYDHSGNASRPYREAGWNIIQVDIKNGIDIMTWDYSGIFADRIGIIIMQPCTCYALCGNRHKQNRLNNGEFEYSQKLVAKSKEIIDYFNPFFWQLENPKTDIHKKNTWIGQRPKFIFNPCDFAGYDPEPGNSRYNKETWLFGKFNDPVTKHLQPFEKDNPGWKNLGGKSERTKELRSITPLGFAYAFYEYNH